MHFALIVAGWGLLAQVSGFAPVPPAPVSPGIVEPPNDLVPATPEAQPSAPAPPIRHRLTPPEIVAEASVAPPDNQLTGRPMTLLAVLTATPDRQTQLQATRAHWRLAEAVASYYAALQQVRRVERIEPADAQAVAWRAARASSIATVREAEVAAVAAQFELAAILQLPPDTPLPLPADPPHVGPYRTELDTVFPSRNAPARARLLDQTLPLRCQALDRRAAALDGAEEALAAATEAHRLQQADLATVVACIEEAARQRRAFLRSVSDYNQEIADYAMAVVRPGTNVQTLLAMMIQVAPQPVLAPSLGAVGTAEPAGYTERVPTPAQRSAPREPTPADPRTRPAEATSSATEATPRQPDKQIPTPATQWVPAQPAEPFPFSVSRPVTDDQAHLADPSSFENLANLPPEARATELVRALLDPRRLPEKTGIPTTLADCLAGRAAADRRALIAAYWTAARRAGEYQALALMAQRIEGLLLKNAQQPDDLARLRTAQSAAEANLLDAHAALLDAQLALATRMGRESNDLWPIPSTAPRSGGYAIALADRASSWPLRRLEATIPAMAKSIDQRATAIFEADAARASQPSLATVRRQTQQTFALLAALSDYNRAVADHALAVLPPDLPAEELAGILAEAP